MQRLVISIILFCSLTYISLSFSSCSEGSSKTDAYISQLDSLLQRHDELERSKLMRIGELRQKLAHAASPTDKYMINSLLLDEFSTYNSDSAMKYVDYNLDIARQVGNKEWENRNNIIK